MLVEHSTSMLPHCPHHSQHNSQFFKHLNLGLDEGSTLGIVAELVNELLDVGTELHLGIIFSLLVLLSLTLGLNEVFIISSE